MVVLIAGISYTGYFSMKYLGKRKGLLFTSFTGFLVSSLAVTVTLGRYGEKIKSTDILITGILITTFTALAAGLWVHFRGEVKKSSDRFSLKNPLQLSTAIQFGLLLAAVMFLSELSGKWFGETGIFGMSLVSGMVDIDSITLTLLVMSKEDLLNNTAAYRNNSCRYDKYPGESRHLYLVYWL